MNRKISGDPYTSACKYLLQYMVKKNYILPVERCLTLGCGAGNLERELAQYNF